MAAFYILWSAFAIACALWWSRPLLRYLNLCVSRIIHEILITSHPIRNVEDKSKHLPSVPFKWPGDGDRDKFLQGVQNSSKWKEKYGNIYRMWSGMNTEVYVLLLCQSPTELESVVPCQAHELTGTSVISRPEHVKAIFFDSDQHYKAVNNDSGWLMSQVLGQCMGLLSQRAWSNLRLHIERPFMSKRIAAITPDIHAETKVFLMILTTRAMSHHGSNTATVHVHTDMKLLPFRLTALLLYGSCLTGHLFDQLVSLIPTREELFTYVIGGNLGRYWLSAFLPYRGTKLLARFQRGWLQFNSNAYAAAKRAGDSPLIVKLWDHMLLGELDQTQLLQTLDEILFANLDVMAGALSWALVNVAKHPEVQQRIYHEIMRCTQDGLRQEALQSYCSASGTYLSATVSESARLKPVAAFSIPQAPPSDRVVEGWLIPAGTNVIVDSYALNIRNSYWGESSEEFDPDRWMNLKPSETRYNMWWFGFGPRQCLGKYLAKEVLHTVLAYLVAEFELQMETKQKINETERTMNCWITQADEKIVLIPRSIGRTEKVKTEIS